MRLFWRARIGLDLVRCEFIKDYTGRLLLIKVGARVLSNRYSARCSCHDLHAAAARLVLTVSILQVSAHPNNISLPPQAAND